MSRRDADRAAARVHWRRAGEHRDAAARFERLGLYVAAEAARRSADAEERLALQLEAVPS